MAINFPNSPINGNTYTYNAVTYVYSKSGTDEGYWRVALPTVSGVATVAEIDAGVDAVKYISPLGLEGSKYSRKSGGSGSRPTVSTIGTPYFDTTLGLPIWWEGSNWVRYDGVIV